MVAPPSPPYIPANLTGGSQSRIDRIVIHGTVSPGTYCGAAEDLGHYFHTLQAPPAGRWASCHYGVDPCETRQYVYDHTIAYHAPPNENSVGIELCDPQSGPDSRWDDAEHERMLDRAADLVRQLCLAYDIPMRWLMPDELAAGARGITDHENVGAAWGQTSHTDPGWSVSRSDDFMRRVRSAAPVPAPVPAPAPQPEEDDDMKMEDPVPKPFEAVPETVGYALHNLLYGIGGVRRDGDIAAALRHMTWRLDSMATSIPALIAQQGEHSPQELAEALRPVIADVVGPFVENAVTTALNADNKDTAEAIVDALAAELAGGGKA